ncbi:hypothetical protein NSQ62_06210 [Solibacillus sp. FSL H8-0523]|uniref:hypothetical protein n=1 Tax=Solibacillus sp. FSL H8-0523 TaxID=2954511 RepID=UPI003101A2EC
MLDSKLKELVRPTLDEETKTRHLATLQSQQTYTHKKQTWGYVTTLVTFAILTLFFIQTLQVPPSSEQQQTDVLTVAPLKKATYLYSTNAERNYQFPSLFISGEMTTTDPEKLLELQQLLNGLKKIPSTAQLSSDEGAAHYLLEQANGEKLYLKKVYRAEGSVLIDVTTKEQIEFTKENADALEQIWMYVQIDNLGVPKWKYVALIVLFIMLFIFKPKRRLEKEKYHTVLIVVSIFTFLVFFYFFTKFWHWYGVVNLPILLLLWFFFSTIDFAIRNGLRKTEQTWKEHFIGLLLGMLFLILLFI